MAVMTTPETSSQPLDVPRPGRYRIDAERSTVTIRTRHLFGLGPVRATLALRDGRVQVTAPPERSTAAARFATSTFRSRNGARDAAVLSPRLLDAEAYPSIAFVATGLVADAGQWSLRGELEVRGVTRPVVVRISAVQTDGAAFRASAEADIDRYDFGITGYRGLAARRLTVRFAITAYQETES
jgi:polyisoprenoid-binding protein YceI